MRDQMVLIHSSNISTGLKLQNQMCAFFLQRQSHYDVHVVLLACVCNIG